MSKVVLVSDNHGNASVLSRIAAKHYDAEYYLHCGDSGMPAAALKPFASVKGNVDYADLPEQKILSIDGWKVLMLHGNRYIQGGDLLALYGYARRQEADVVLFGHTHCFTDTEIEGIRFINPGSCAHNRDGSAASYAIVHFGDEITVERQEVSAL